jgi:hypothetical protein
MATREDIKHYLIQTAYPHEMIEDDMGIVRDAASIVIADEPPLVIFRSKLMGRAAKPSGGIFSTPPGA